MNLYRLSKAGKPGLIAVQKPVTKNGKTFMQTFYVKAADKPKPIEKKVQKRPYADPNDLEATKNSPMGGFWIAVAATQVEKDQYESNTGNESNPMLQVAMKVPTSQIAGVHKHAGYTFIMHREHDVASKTWGPGYVLTELTTGMKAGPAGTQKEVLDRFNNNIKKNFDEEKMAKVIGQQPVITKRHMSMADSEAWVENRPATDMEIDSVAGWLLDRYESDWNRPAMSLPFGKEDLRDFIKRNATDKLSVDKLDKEPLPLMQVYAGIALNVDAYTADRAVENVGLITEQYKEIFGAPSSPYMWKNIIDWSARFEVGIEDDYWEMDDYDTSHDKYGNEDGYGQTGEYLVINAYASDSDPQQVKNEVEADAEKAREDGEMEAYDSEWTNPTTDIEWNSSEFFALGKWIKNAEHSVSESRALGKEFDRFRKDEGKAPIITDPIVSMLHEKAVGYTETEMLFRGTKNKDWQTLEPGDIMPFSMGSFSKSRNKAHEFGTWQGEPTVLEMKVNPDEMQNPVMAVDVDELIYSAEDAGMEMANLINASGVNTHATEREVIVRAPSLRILEVEHIEMSDENQNARGYWRVAVEPADMNLIAMAKALFAERDDIIEGAERTFDYPLHDEPDWENL